MFLFSMCQVGAERVLKSETERLYPDFRSSFSRPGFVTFKASEEDDDRFETVSDFAEQSIFARTASISLGKVLGTDFETIARESWQIFEENKLYANRVHVFRRDPFQPGENDFEPGATPELRDLHRILTSSSPKPKFLGHGASEFDHPALPGETVLDLVQVEPELYYVGAHRIEENSSIQAYYPGGVMPIVLPAGAASRAWLKFEEGLRWSGLPIEKNSVCLDIGASPGGGSQVLLARGAEVLGVDPAEIDPVVLKNPKFTHIRGKINQTRRNLYNDVRWVIADMNVAPGYTMNVLEDLVQRPGMNIRGMLFTLKLFQWDLAADLPLAADVIRGWGFSNVKIKQLAFNRQEVMVAASAR